MLTTLLFTCALARPPSALQAAWAEEDAFQRADSARDEAALLRQDPATLHLELLIADASEAQAASRWGHALLRFVDADEDPFNDLVLGFGAALDSPHVSVWKGILGGYEVAVMVRRLGWVYLDYVQSQGRGLERIPLPSDAAHVAALQHALTQRAAGRPYTFLRANCAGLLVELLRDAGFPVPARGARVPVRLDDALATTATAPLPAVHAGPPEAVFLRAAALTGLDADQIRSGDWPAGTGERLVELVVADRLRLLYATTPPSTERAALLASLPPDRPPYAALLGFEALPEDFYAICTEVECARRVRTSAEARFGVSAIERSLARAPVSQNNPFERHVGLLREVATK